MCVSNTTKVTKLASIWLRQKLVGAIAEQDSPISHYHPCRWIKYWYQTISTNCVIFRKSVSMMTYIIRYFKLTNTIWILVMLIIIIRFIIRMVNNWLIIIKINNWVSIMINSQILTMTLNQWLPWWSTIKSRSWSGVTTSVSPTAVAKSCK